MHKLNKMRRQLFCLRSFFPLPASECVMNFHFKNFHLFIRNHRSVWFLTITFVLIRGVNFDFPFWKAFQFID